MFDSLLPGFYVVSAARLLTPDEKVLLGPANQDVDALGGAAFPVVAAPATATTVETAAGRRGSLVISEVFAGEPYAPSGNFFYYPYATYIKLHNNADTAIELNGKVIGRGISWFRDFSSPRSCSEMEQWRNDPDGLWTKHFDAFPPLTLAPGGDVVVATDAIDHSAIVPGLPNLTSADFEFSGSNDVDTPVPNMTRSGLGEWGATIFGHGLAFGGNGIYFVADSLTVNALVRGNLPVVDPPHVRIPGAKLLDVFTTGETPELEAAATAEGFPLCPQLVHSNFDRQSAGLYDPRESLGSIQRRVFTTLPGGRVVLLHTRSSGNDFGLASRSQ